MHISDEGYFCERQRHDLALRMIAHEARTCTIRLCTGLTDDRIRRLCKTGEHQLRAPLRRRRGKSPRLIAFFTRTTRLQLESSLLAGMLITCGVLQRPSASLRARPAIELGQLFCDAYETHTQLAGSSSISFEHAWFLLELLGRDQELQLRQCRRCSAQYLRDAINAAHLSCPFCRVLAHPSRDDRPGPTGCQRDRDGELRTAGLS